MFELRRLRQRGSDLSRHGSANADLSTDGNIGADRHPDAYGAARRVATLRAGPAAVRGLLSTAQLGHEMAGGLDHQLIENVAQGLPGLLQLRGQDGEHREVALL